MFSVMYEKMDKVNLISNLVFFLLSQLFESLENFFI